MHEKKFITSKHNRKISSEATFKLSIRQIQIFKNIFKFKNVKKTIKYIGLFLDIVVVLAGFKHRKQRQRKV